MFLLLWKNCQLKQAHALILAFECQARLKLDMLALCKNEVRFFGHRLFKKGSKVNTSETVNLLHLGIGLEVCGCLFAARGVVWPEYSGPAQ